MDRRALILGASWFAALVPSQGAADSLDRSGSMYGLITQFFTMPEQRESLVSVLVTGSRDLPGCISYVVGVDAARDDSVWVTEVWQDKESHGNSLRLASVQAALAKGRPLITGVGTRVETVPANLPR